MYKVVPDGYMSQMKILFHVKLNPHRVAEDQTCQFLCDLFLNPLSVARAPQVRRALVSSKME